MIHLSKIATACCVVTASIAVLPFQQSAQQSAQKQEKELINASQQDPDAVSRRDFMRTKMLFSQHIFEGLITGNFKEIETAVEEVQQITAGAQWVAIDSDEYRKYTREFENSTARLMEAAKTKNIDATALRFYELSTRCIDCHKHIRKAGYRL